MTLAWNENIKSTVCGKANSTLTHQDDLSMSETPAQIIHSFSSFKNIQFKCLLFSLVNNMSQNGRGNLNTTQDNLKTLDKTPY